MAKVMMSAVDKNSDSQVETFTRPCAISKTSWLELVNQYLNEYKTQRDSKATSKLRSLRFRQATWLDLIDLSGYDCCVVLESGLGVHAIKLAKYVERVVFVKRSNDKARLVQSRLDYLNVNNVKVESLESLSKRPPEGKLLFVGSDGNNDVDFETTFKRLNQSIGFQDYAVISGLNSMRTLFSSKSYQTLHITGKIDQPFKFEPAAQKRQKFGWFKYQVFRLSERINHLPRIQTSASFEESLFNRLVIHAASKMDGYYQPVMEFGYFVKPLGVLIKVSDKNCSRMIRIALNEKAKNKFKRARNVLNTVKDSSDQFPKVFSEGEFEGFYYLVETCFDGSNLVRERLADERFLADFYFQSTDLLSRMQRGSYKESKEGAAAFDSHIGFLVDGVSQCFSPEHNNVFTKIRHYLQKEFDKYGHPTVLSHGDFSVDNILTDKGKISGLIDWEFSREQGTPLVDLLFLMVSVFKFVAQEKISKAMKNKLLLQKFSDLEKTLIDQYCVEFKVNALALNYYCVLTILEFLYFRLDIPDEVRRDNVYEKNYGLLLTELHKFVVDKS